MNENRPGWVNHLRRDSRAQWVAIGIIGVLVVVEIGCRVTALGILAEKVNDLKFYEKEDMAFMKKSIFPAAFKGEPGKQSGITRNRLLCLQRPAGCP